MKTNKLILNILLGVTILATLLAANYSLSSAAGGDSVSVTVPNCKKWHTVQRGEYLTKIAAMYDTTWRKLAEINNLANPSKIYPGQVLCVSVTGNNTSPVTPLPGCSERVQASSVVEDRSVTLKGYKLLPKTRYEVFLGKYGWESARYIRVGTVLADSNGAFSISYSLPKRLVDVARIGIIINGSGDSASNWFYNATASGNTGGKCLPPFSFSIVSVKKDAYVEIKTTNLPANQIFNVLMGKAGSQGVKGLLVGSLRDGDGVIRAKFEIPDELLGDKKIDIRVENSSMGVFYYLTFENVNR